MNVNYGKYLKYMFVLACAILLIYFLPAILHLLMPFILAFAIAIPCHKLVEFLNRKLKISRSIVSAVILILICGTVLGLIGLLLYYLVGQLQSFISVLPDTIENAQNTFMDYYHKYNSSIPGVIKFIEDAISSYKPPTIEITTSALGYVKSFATSIPSILFFALIFVLAMFFFIKDYSKVMDFFREILPQKLLDDMSFIKKTAWNGFIGYVKSQVILSSITALLVAVTFWFLGTPYSVIWGLIVGIVDALPIVGSGIVLVPYAIIHYILNRNLFFAVCILILQTVVFIVRQALSPRVMSSQLGLHPIITLLAIYIGNELMGVMGMVIFPILALLLVSLYTSYKDAGRIGHK